MRISKDEYFLNIANQVSKRSTCIHVGRQYGCIIVDSDAKIVSTGYNGSIRGQEHCTVETCEKDRQEISSGKGHFECHAVHAEMNALLQAGKQSKGSTLYINGRPCRLCARLMVNVQIKRVVYFEDQYPDEEGLNVLEKSGVEVVKFNS